MVAVTFGVARVRDAARPDATPAAPRKSLWHRFIDAMIESRLRQAEREIRLYTEMMSERIEPRGHRPVSRKPADMPAGGW